MRRLQLDEQVWEVGEPLQADNAGFGRVHVASSDAYPDAVAKFVPKVSGAYRELLIGQDLRNVSSAVTIPVLDVGETEEDFVLVMPRAQMSLQQRLSDSEPVALREVVEILTDVAGALAQLEAQVVHRDLKPANVLRLEGTWRLADFGIARYAQDATSAETRKHALTPSHAAPEQWRGDHATPATDVYAFGVMAYQLIAGRLPFTGPDWSDFRDQHLHSNPPDMTAGTQRLRNIAMECLLKAPEARPRAANILARLAKAAIDPVSPGAQRLAEANSREATRRFDSDTAAAAARDAAARRQRLFASGVALFASVSEPLIEAVEDNAPLAEIRKGHPDPKLFFDAGFGQSRLTLYSPAPAEWRGPFDVVATSVICILVPTTRDGWQGRAHSLWYCDAHTRGHYGWFELAFMDHPFMGGQPPALSPYSLPPGEASLAFGGAGGGRVTQLAWPVTPIDLDDPSEFVDRWLGWFADAATGILGRPTMMPERNPSSSWRRI